MNELNFLKKLELGLQLERLVIGIEEPVLVKDLGEILAKIDSGNGGYNVIHGEDIIYQGNYINFLTYDGAGNPKRMSKKVVEELEIHIGGGIVQKRPVIQLDVKFANEDYKKILFSVTDRTDNSHRILISKDFVENTINALIDVGAKNISNMSYDVEYLPVNESENDESPIKLDAKGNELKIGDKVKADGTKAGFVDKITDKIKTLSGENSELKEVTKDKEVVEEWKPCAEMFSAYSSFYNKDQNIIQKKINSASHLIQKLLTGDVSKMIFEGKNNKIMTGNLKGIPIFGYNLKKGNSEGNGSKGQIISGLEQVAEKWKQINKDIQVATIRLKKSEADYQIVEEIDGLQSESLDNFDSNLINEVKSLDATNIVLNKSPKNKKQESMSDDQIQNIQSETLKIKNLKGFIFYFIPFYKGDNKSSLKMLNDAILSGSFDGMMKDFISSGNGNNDGALEILASSIKKYIEKDELLYEQLPGIFALCYSQETTKNSPREIRFLSERTVIVKTSPDDENTDESYEDDKDIDMEVIKSSLEKKLNLPQPVNPDNEKEIENLINLIQNPSSKSSDGELNLENIKNKLLKLNFPQSENPDDENSINGLLNTISGSQNDGEIDLKMIKKKLSNIGLPTSDSIKADNHKPMRVVDRIFKTLGIKNPAPKKQKVTNTNISDVTPRNKAKTKRKTPKTSPILN